MKKGLFTVLMILLLMSVAMNAFAVTYRNDGNAALPIVDSAGSLRMLYPGETIETYTYNSNASLTKISDAPYYNRVLDRDHVTATPGGVNVGINLDTGWIIIEKITGTVDVFIQSASNTPPEYDDRTANDYIIQIPAHGKFDNLVITGSGDCDVVQYREVR